MSSRRLLIALGTLFVIAVLATIVYSTMGIHDYAVESCIVFHGRRACGTAAGSTREEALRAAARIACTSLASGMTEDIACQNTEPESVRWISE